MYRHTRHIYNPARRIVEFHACHIYNGTIDPLASDGSETPSAIPILIDDEAGSRQDKVIRSGLGALWRASRWGIENRIWTRYGAAMGDAPLLVEDIAPTDYSPGQILLRPIHPATIKWHQRDRSGNIIGFIREERRLDPTKINSEQWKNIRSGADPLDSIPWVTFTEECELLPGDGVRFKTFLNYMPFDWVANLPQGKGGVAEWVSPIPCVPLVMCQHIPFGANYGMSEIQADQPKIREVDDQASKLGDQIRKITDPIWLYSGFKKSDVDLALAQTVANATKPEADRDQLPTLYASDTNAKAQALVFEAQIEAISANIEKINLGIEDDHPELRYDRLSAAGALSGTAIRLARKPAETKVNERRAVYDPALSHAQEIALVWGGINGYPGYAPSSFGDMANGRFRHAIGPRSVFGVDPLDRLEEDTAEATAVMTWGTAGVPVAIALAKIGWSEADIKKVTEAIDAKEKADAQKAAALASNGVQNTDGAAVDPSQED